MTRVGLKGMLLCWDISSVTSQLTPCVCNQLSQQLGYSHLVVMCTCVASARYGITVVYRMTVEPVGGGGGGGGVSP